MPVPSYRVPVRVARGTLAALTAGLADLQEGELCYATDENILYVIEGGVLTPTVAAGGSGDLVDDTTPQLGGDLDTNAFQIISTAAGNIQIAPDTTGVLEVMGNTGNDAAIQLNCETNAHGIKLKSPPHSAAASYTLVFPNDTGTSGQALTTDGSGVMSWTTPSTVGSINDLTDVSYASGSLDITALDQISFTSSDTPAGVTRKVYTNASFGMALASYTTADTQGSFVYAHETNGVELRSYVGPIRLVGDTDLTSNQPELRWESGNATAASPTGNYIGLKMPANVTVDQTYVLPVLDGSAGQALSTDGSGVLSWVTPGADLSTSSVDELQDVDTTTTAPTTNQVLAWDGTNWVPADQSGGGGGVTSIIAGAGISVDQATGDVTVTATGGGGGGGGSSAARLTEAQTAASGIATFVGIGHSGTLVEVTSSLDAWIVLYDSAASRTADNGRAYNTDPASGSGVLAEFYITAGTTVLATPGTTYFNNDTSVTEAIYAAVRDQAGADVDSQVTIVAYGNQTIDSISGGTFGSGI